jgi:hypothetical protein
MAKKPAPPKPNKDFQLIRQIRGNDQTNAPGEKFLYKANAQVRDRRVRKFVDENLQTKGKTSILPGQLIMFNYFEPKTKEELKYYDAMPCTIFFGIIQTENGPRVIGFNLHYYPPRIRYELMDRIFDIYKPLYLKSWNNVLKQEMSYFNYKQLIQQLQKAKLDFGIRMYIPELMHKITPIPPSSYAKAVFTEGHFRKETREQILKYWKDKSTGIEKKPANPVKKS